MKNPAEATTLEVTEPQAGYELIDSGDGEKLERFGSFVVRRPDPQALWPKFLPEGEWEKADASYEKKGAKGAWRRREGLPDTWHAELDEKTFLVELSPFKHVGLFPEQQANWRWIERTIIDSGRSEANVLNLFGYTGGATLAAAFAAASVTHVDASKPSLTQARDNAELSGFKDAQIRWMLDDAFKFVEREVRRGSAYDGIVMDPPVYGRGAKGELWKIEEKLVPLLRSCRKLLSKEPLFVILNGYASGFSSIAYRNNIQAIFGDLGGRVESGELAIRESKGGRLLPAGIFSRWSRS